MNRTLTLMAASLAMLAGCAKQPNAAGMERARANAFEHCMASAQNENTRLPPKIVEYYCTCAADKIVTQLSAADLIRIYQGSDEAANRELEPLLQECFDKAAAEVEAEGS